AAAEAARKAGETANQAATAARERFGQFDEEHKVTDNLRDAAARAGEAVRQGAQVAQTGVEQFSQATEETAREVFGGAKAYYKRAEQAYNAGTAGARMAEAAMSGYEKARAWVKENPGKTAAVTFSMIAGIRAGSALPSLGATILGAGAAGHWF